MIIPIRSISSLPRRMLVIVLILVPVMYSFFGTSARHEEVEEFAQAMRSNNVDEEQREWLSHGLPETTSAS